MTSAPTRAKLDQVLRALREFLGVVQPDFLEHGVGVFNVLADDNSAHLIFGQWHKANVAPDRLLVDSVADVRFRDAMMISAKASADANVSARSGTGNCSSIICWSIGIGRDVMTKRARAS